MEGYVRNGFSSNGNCDALISQELERNREPSTASRKRKKSKNGCINEGNDILVEELQKIRERLKDSTSHLSNNYRRAIASIKNHSEEIHNGKEAMQLKSIGNYIGNQIQAILQKNKRPIAVATPPVPPVLLPVSTPPVLSLTPPVQDHTNTSVFVVAKEPEPEAENVNTKRIYVPAMRKRKCVHGHDVQ
jgi:hypothetical protein